MKAFVFTDAALERYAGRFVWLSIDTEKAANAPFLSKFPIPALPTMLIIDPQQESVVLRYVGGATVPQLTKILDDGARAMHKSAADSADGLLAEADRLASTAKHAEAAKKYEAAIAKAPKGWSRLGRAAESLVFSAGMAGDDKHCAQLALGVYPKVRGTVSAANVASGGLGCAVSIAEGDADRPALMEKLETATREVFDDPKIHLSGDDRSGLYISLIGAREAADDEAATKQLKQEWVVFLEQEAAQAKTPQQRTVYDSHRLSAYLDLGTPEKAVPMLEQSERDFPDDYNPPARLAVAYNALKRYDDALAAADRALQHVYGPRKLNVLINKSDVYLAKGDKDAARRTLEEALAYAKSLPESQRNPRRIAAIEKKLAGIAGN